MSATRFKFLWFKPRPLGPESLQGRYGTCRDGGGQTERVMRSGQPKVVRPVLLSTSVNISRLKYVVPPVPRPPPLLKFGWCDFLRGPARGCSPSGPLLWGLAFAAPRLRVLFGGRWVATSPFASVSRATRKRAYLVHSCLRTGSCTVCCVPRSCGCFARAGLGALEHWLHQFPCSLHLSTCVGASHTVQVPLVQTSAARP